MDATTPPAPAPVRYAPWKYVALAVLAAGWIAGLVMAVGPSELAQAFAQASWPPVLAAAVVIAAATLVGGWNAFQVSGFGSGLSFRRFLAAYWCGWGIGLVAPGQVGDIVSVAALLRRWGIRATATVGRLGIDKAASLLVAATAVLALPWVVGRDAALLPHDVPLARVGAGIALGVLLLGAVFLLRGLHWSRRLAAVVAETLGEAAAIARATPGRVALNIVLTLVKFGLTGLSYWLVFSALGHDVSWARATVVAVAAGLVAYIPISLNGIGTVEIAGVVLFGLLGLPAPVVACAYLVLRSLNLLVAWVPIGAILPRILKTPPSPST